MYIFITSQCIHNVVDYCIGRFVARFVEHTPNKERLQTKQRERDQLPITLDAQLKHMLLSRQKFLSDVQRFIYINSTYLSVWYAYDRSNLLLNFGGFFLVFPFVFSLYSWCLKKKNWVQAYYNN